MVLSVFGALISIGIIYGTFKTRTKEHTDRIDKLEKQVSGMIDHNSMLIEVKAKVDILITHFLKEKQ